MPIWYFTPDTWGFLEYTLSSPTIWLLLWLSWGWRWWWVSKYFIKRQRWCLFVQLVHFIEKLIETESGFPGWISISLCPHVDEFISNTITSIYIVDELDNLFVLGLIKEYKWSSNRILGWKDELKANWSTLVIDLDWQLASDLYAIVFLISRNTNADDLHFTGSISWQEFTQMLTNNWCICPIVWTVLE